MRAIGIILMAVFALLPACENYDLDMHDQVTFRTQEFPRFRRPVNSVPLHMGRVDYSNVDGVTLQSPYPMGEKEIATGKKLFEIYCTPCHGSDGTTTGMPVADKMDPRPADITGEAVISLTEGEIFQRIVEGFGIMPAYKRDMTDEEAWGVTAYIMKHIQKRD